MDPDLYYLVGQSIDSLDFGTAPPPVSVEVRSSLEAPIDTHTFPITVPASTDPGSKFPVKLIGVWAVSPLPDGVDGTDPAFFLDAANGFPTVTVDTPISDITQPTSFTIQYTGDPFYGLRRFQVIEAYTKA